MAYPYQPGQPTPGGFVPAAASQQPAPVSFGESMPSRFCTCVTSRCELTHPCIVLFLGRVSKHRARTCTHLRLRVMRLALQCLPDRRRPDLTVALFRARQPAVPPLAALNPVHTAVAVPGRRRRQGHTGVRPRGQRHRELMAPLSAAADLPDRRHPELSVALLRARHRREPLAHHPAAAHSPVHTVSAVRGRRRRRERTAPPRQDQHRPAPTAARPRRLVSRSHRSHRCTGRFSSRCRPA